MQRMIPLLAILSAACGGGGSLDTDTQPVVGAWTAEVSAVGEDGHSGFATVTILPGGTTRADATLAGGSAGGKHPWVIHEGTCEAEGALVGDSDGYPPLEPNDLGNASATATLAVVLASGEPYSLRIYRSPEDRETIVGCGELESTR
ncbi:hypothetical protein BH18GEM1_BH18GEM1_17240 [soil metagenome]